MQAQKQTASTPLELANIKQFISKQQAAALREIARGEESGYAVEVVEQLEKTTLTMPKTYEQDGKGRQAVAYLHYFVGGNDWYITEKDMCIEQHQAFGVARLNGHEPELGYISIVELVANNVELDFHFEPATLETIL